jgi:glucose-1-phosphate adenylyltransferase
VLDAPALGDVLADGEGDLWADLLPALAAAGGLALWRPPEGSYWRDVDTLDDLRAVSLDFQGSAPCDLPQAESAPPGPFEDEDGRALLIEVAGLRLSAPRFGARQRGRWTLLEDSLVLPGARVAPGARLSRAVVAPGAVVPANLVVGEDAAEDARWFRVTPKGTTLITAPMLAARAAERMRAQAGSRLSGLATTPRAPG